MKKYRLFVLFCLLSTYAMAQTAPKWAEKAKKAIFSIVTYDANNKIKNTGNGFFISDEGVALSDYSLFKDVDHAIITDVNGVQSSVSLILGANDIFNLVKFKVDIKKKVTALTITTTPPPIGSEVLLLPYNTQKSIVVNKGTIKEETPMGPHHYYTMQLHLTDNLISCPVLTPKGEVFGMAQKNVGKDANISYAISAALASELTINAFSLNDAALNSIGIKKALPEKEDQALVMLYLGASGNSHRYEELLNDFVSQFPSSSEGYFKRASFNVYTYSDAAHMEQVENDMNKSFSLSNKKSAAYSNNSRIFYTYALKGINPPYKDWTYQKSQTEIQKAIKEDPQPTYYEQAADIYFSMKNYKDAFDAYQKVNQSKQATATTFYSAAKAAEMLKSDTATIVNLLDSAISKYTPPYPEEASTYLFERGYIQFQQGKYRAATTDFDAYEQSVKLTPNALFYYYREQALFQSNQFARALQDINKTVQLAPNNKDYLTEQGIVNLRIAHYDDAINSLNAVLKIDPKYGAAYRMIGFCLLQQKKKTEAINNFKKAIDLGDAPAKKLLEKYGK